MNQRIDWVENLQRDLRGALSAFDSDLKIFAEAPLETRLSKVRAALDGLDPITETKPKKCAEAHRKKWGLYLSGSKSALDAYSVRRLCWDPDVAADKRFRQYLTEHSIEMTGRSIRGLVFSAHMKWSAICEGETGLVEIKDIIRRYRGSNGCLRSWKRTLDEVAGESGPQLLAQRVVEKQRSIPEAFKEKNLFCGTEFYRTTQRLCIDLVLKSISNRPGIDDKSQAINYLCSEIFSLDDLPPELFKSGVGRLILNESLTRFPELVDRVKDYVLLIRKLGDPRLSRNGIYWAGIDEAAKNKVIEWLCRADIIFFFDNVLPSGADKHGRKDFWLRYVGNCPRTRCLLGNEDNARLVPMFRRTQLQVEGYGRLHSTMNSAFLLDFGTVLAVEFSRVGACYLYDATRLPRHLKDFWTSVPLGESNLKNQAICVGRITHFPGWQHTLSGELAKRGIRPR